MKTNTMTAIESLLNADETVTPEQHDCILKAMKQTFPKRELVSAKEALQMLDISRTTLRAYVKAGHLEQVNLSARKVRFDKQQVAELAYRGVSK